jgi:hypothetical protein
LPVEDGNRRGEVLRRVQGILQGLVCKEFRNKPAYMAVAFQNNVSENSSDQKPQSFMPDCMPSAQTQACTRATKYRLIEAEPRLMDRLKLFWNPTSYLQTCMAIKSSHISLAYKPALQAAFLDSLKAP